ncbi:MAG: enoyl-CoA hydratase [Mycobacteriaceae bacterium]|nr:enoyl-CoA hydratase [Mycobacteriaceae bacterium]
MTDADGPGARPTQVGDLRVEREGARVRVTIERPRRMNAVDLATMRGLSEVIAATAADSTVRVIVLTGAGTSFCTGADLAAAAAGGGAEASPDVVMDTANGVIRAIVAAPIPVIARINGPAAGVGLSIALAADLSYAVESGYLLLPFVNIGLMPDGGAVQTIAAAIGRARTAEMALLGERLAVPAAAAAGLITKAVPDDQLDSMVDAVADKLAAGPRRAIEYTKQAVNDATLAGLEAALEREKTGQRELLGSADFLEGMVAMLSHRKPTFG